MNRNTKINIDECAPSFPTTSHLQFILQIRDKITFKKFQYGNSHSQTSIHFQIYYSGSEFLHRVSPFLI